VFTPSNNVLQYWIYDTLAPPVNVNQVALFGPDSCLALYPGSYPDEYVGGGSCSYSAPQQIVLTTLGSGPTISTVTLNTGQIEMVFFFFFWLFKKLQNLLFYFSSLTTRCLSVSIRPSTLQATWRVT